ncbi:hypothetical protein [Mesonia sp. K4-1]|uniref:hypothetical protein n=1 Tax=Mesonia sp. K4-1 TaxID=2602760 RepID=UPI0011C7F233|nr:hypothetical protein [Mesonia sp. K4-1]TXK78591.1 hypothetical protein FT986_02020 [Mesonia sp. K4-1]
MLGKKEKERLFLDKYLDQLEEKFEIESTESPDFILTRNNYKIGCEITDFYSDYSDTGSILKRSEVYVNRLHKIVRKRIKERYPEGYSINIHYSHLVINQLKFIEEAKSLEEEIKNHINERQIINPTPNIRRVIILKTNHSTIINKSVTSNYEDTKEEYINYIVKSKSQLASKWFSKFESNWLIICAGASGANDLDLRDISSSDKFEFYNWNRIILVDIFTSKILEIKENSKINYIAF